MSIEALKEQARRHEQKEEWQKALEQYKKAIRKLEADDQPDIGLYNRVGDLFVRVGNLEGAVEHYNMAADLYMEAELPNNAIAVCKKVIRNVPDRHEAYLRMGQIRARQGFLPDARTNFLTYAERMQKAGDINESFRALVEFCDLAPDEVDVREAVAEQMASHDRTEDAVKQLMLAYRSLLHRGDGRAGEVEARIRQLDPNADLSAIPPAPSGEGRLGFEAASALDELAGAFGEVDLGEAGEPATSPGGPAGGLDTPSFDISTADEAAADEEEAPPLPTFGFEDEEEEVASLPTFGLEDDEEEEAAPLPTFGLEDEEEAVPLPTFGTEDEDDEDAASLLALGLSDEDDDEDVPLPTFGLGVDEPPVGGAATAGEDTLAGVRAHIRANPDDQALRQRLVELAYQSGDESVLVEAYMGLGETLQRAGLGARAKAAFQQVLQLDARHAGAKAALGYAAPPAPRAKEVASSEDYVDLGSLLLGDEEEKTTRFVVAYEEPSGDEAADFAKMLSQFKEKVSQNVGVDDVRAHYDLGTAYKEMGLLDEAVSQFQQALRASSDHLPTYELLGQTFMDMGQPDAAIRSLRRALDVDFEIEDELIAIYYHLGRAYQQIGNNESALEFYDRVFSLDINFADVTERLRALR